MKRNLRPETRGRKKIFKNGRKSMAVVFDPLTYSQLEKLSEQQTKVNGSPVSKGELVRRAVNHWLKEIAPLT